MKTYSNFFARDGFINMWARSICYAPGFRAGFHRLHAEPSPVGPRLGPPALLRLDTAVHGAGRLLRQRHSQPRFLRHKEYMLQSYSCRGVRSSCSCLSESAARKFAVLDGEGERWNVGEIGRRIPPERAGKAGNRAGESRQDRHLRDHPGKVYDDDHNYSKLVYNTHFPGRSQPRRRRPWSIVSAASTPGSDSKTSISI